MHDNSRKRITGPLPSWRRFRHVRTARYMDFNPANPDHQELIPYYAGNPDWLDVTDEYQDEFCEDQK